MNGQQNDFLRRVLIVAGVAILSFLVMALVWRAAEALLIIFAGVLLAVFLRALGDSLSRMTHLPGGWSLAIVVVALAAVLGLGGWLLADRISDQVGQLKQTLPVSLDQVEQRIRQTGIGQYLFDQARDGGLLSGGSFWSRAFGLLSSLLGLVTSVIVILFVGLYLAAEPGLYRRGVTRLISPAQRERAEQALGRLGHMLRWWLLGQAVSMVCVGALITLGLWLLDVPLALTLGLIAALLEFIPRVGPVIGAIPAALISLGQNQQQTVYVILLYVAVQLIESYLILPLIQRKAVDLPPALTITTLFLMGILFGFIGLLLAAPLTVVAMSLVKQLYVEDYVENRREIETGERSPGGLDVGRERFA